MRRILGVFLLTCAVQAVVHSAVDDAPQLPHPLVGAVLPMAVGVGPMVSLSQEEVTVVVSRNTQEEELQWSQERWLFNTMAGAYWPSLDEAPWPETESVQLLNDFMSERWEARMRLAYAEDHPKEMRQGMTLLQQLTSAAKDEGVITDRAVWERELGDDPWARAHQMMLYRAVEYEGILSEDLRRPDQGDGLEETLFLAMALEEDFPDHPASDLARLVLLEGVEDDEQAQALINTVIQSDDEALRAAAVGHYMALGDGPVARELTLSVQDTLSEMSPALQGGLALQITKHTASSPPTALARYLPGEVALRRGLRAATDYQEELELAAWRCNEQAPLTDQDPKTMVLYWSGQWDVNATPSPFYSCLVRSPVQFEPASERLLLTVVVDD